MATLPLIVALPYDPVERTDLIIGTPPLHGDDDKKYTVRYVLLLKGSF